ncbi:MAG: acyl-CoA reductase [Phaeodactylibacter sp.]|nr:acyl-CoA reductase [Phaeodactylibacter sp.]
MNLQERLAVLAQLGQHLRGEDDYLHAIMQRSRYHNLWFTIENQESAVMAIAEHFLDGEKMRLWLSRYTIPEHTEVKTVAIVMAGNLPLVGFHDLLCVFAAGHKSLIKLSDKDQYLLPYLLKLMGQFDERAMDYFETAERLQDFDAVIATGSNNSARYFEAYFGKYPHIIRKNRNGIAVLDGNETQEELQALGLDIFRYFGLGCRNVSKIYVPRHYKFEPLLEALHEHRDIVLHDKYKNNFDYNYALYILNKEQFMANGCIILTENSSLQSRIAGLHYEYYDELQEVEQEIRRRAEEIQLVAARPGLLQQPSLPFGKSQQPELWDYADGVDTMAFLLELP